MDDLSIPTGKTMRRSLSVSLSRVSREKDDLVAKTAREDFKIPDNLVEFLVMVQVDIYSNIPAMISLANPPEMPQLAEALVTIYAHENNLHMMRLLKYCMDTHLKQCQNEKEQIFRGTSLETKIISVYMQRECHEYAKKAINPLLGWIAAEGRSLEVDPSKAAPMDVASNAKMLINAANMLLSSVVVHSDLIPRHVCDFFKVVRSSVEKKFPDMAEKSVASLLFLRLLNPYLVTPESYLDFKNVTPSMRRSLILISKLIQNLANGVEFGEKEDYLIFANDWLRGNTKTMNDFIFDCIFAIRKPAHDVLPRKPDLEVFHNSIRWVHNFFCIQQSTLSDKMFEPHFRGVDGRKKRQTFLAQLRKCTNNFKPVTQEDMPIEWVRQLGLDRNLLQRSYNKIMQRKRRDSQTPDVKEEEPVVSPLIGMPVLNQSDALAVARRQDEDGELPRQRLRRGKSLNMGSRFRVAKKGEDEKAVVVQNPLTPTRVRPRDDNLDLIPMELSTPALQEMVATSPLKKHKQRESIGELATFTPLRDSNGRLPNPTRGHQ